MIGLEFNLLMTKSKAMKELNGTKAVADGEEFSWSLVFSR